jgi:hypothetical protein
LARGVWRAIASYKLEAYPLSLYASFLDKILEANDWDSGSTKVAKMGVHTPNQWRNNLHFFPTIAYSCHLFLYKI